MRTRFLEAEVGDAIWIDFTDNEGKCRNILIDGGTAGTYQKKDKKGKIEYYALSNVIDFIKGEQQKVDLLILTHIDNDHIKGITTWFENDPSATGLIRQVLFNSGQLISNYFGKPDVLEHHIQLTPSYIMNTGVDEGVTFEKAITDAGIWTNKIIKAGQEIDFYGLKFKMLSPDDEGLEALLTKWKEKAPESVTGRANDYKPSLLSHIEADRFSKDNSVHNGSSIAFILTYKNKNMLFLADAHPAKIINGLTGFGFSEANKLHCEFIKIAHHGSKYNTNRELLKLIESPVYVISSDGSGSALPHKQCLARIIDEKKNLSLYFNYNHVPDLVFKEEDFQAFPNLKILPVDHEFLIE